MMPTVRLAAFGSAHADSVLFSLRAPARKGVRGGHGSASHQFGTAVAKVTGLGSRRDDGRLPGRSLTPIASRMVQLYCLPVPCRCGRHDRYRSAYGSVHVRSEECPFASLPVESPLEATCCALSAECARKNLLALDQDGLANDMEDDLSCEHAVRLGLRIHAWLKIAEEHYRNGERTPQGRVTAVSVDDENGVRPVAYATFEHAIASIRIAACWYEEVGRRGYGVKAQLW